MSATAYIHDSRLFLQPLCAEIPTMNWLPRNLKRLPPKSAQLPGCQRSMKNRGRDQGGGISHSQKRLCGMCTKLGGLSRAGFLTCL